MSSVFFDSAARILSTVFNWLQTSSQGKTANLVVDTFQAGINNAVVGGEGFTLVPGTSPLSVTVDGQGIAYDINSNRIFISSSDVTLYNASNVTTTTNNGLGTFISTPQSTGCVNIPLTPSVLNYLWIDYLATTNTSAYTLNEITKAKIFFELTDGYNIIVTTVNTPPDSASIYLGSVNAPASGIITSGAISQTGRQYFNILPNIVPITTAQANRSDATVTYNTASTYVLETHIKAVGTGTVNATNPHGTSLADLGVTSLDTVTGHRQLEHGTIQASGNAAANTIIAGVPGIPSPSTSAMATSINIVSPGSDYITVDQLLSTEFALINGTAFNVTAIFGAIPTNANVFFPNVSGTYSVFWDSTVKAFSSTTADISADVTKLWLCSVTYSYVGSGPSDHNALSSLTDRRRIGSSMHLLQRWLSSARPGSGLTAPASGEFGFNLTNSSFEYWDGSAWQQPVNTSSNATVPTGTLLPFAGAVAPTGFLLANGSAVSRTTFASLFSVIGVIYGPGDGSTTFNIPNMINSVAIGAGSIASLGTTFGEQNHTLTTGEMPTHSHTVNDPGHGHTVNDPGHNHSHSDPGHSHSLVNTTPAGSAGVVAVQSTGPNQGIAGGGPGGGSFAELATAASSTGISNVANTTGISNAVNTTGISNNNTGGGGSHNNVQPSLGVTYVIKT